MGAKSTNSDPAEKRAAETYEGLSFNNLAGAVSNSLFALASFSVSSLKVEYLYGSFTKLLKKSVPSV